MWHSDHFGKHIDKSFHILGRHTVTSFLVSFSKWTYSPLKGQAILRIFNNVDLKLIKTQSHGWVPSLLWSWEWSPLPQWLYNIVQKQHCIKDVCRWNFQFVSCGLTLQFLNVNSKSIMLPKSITELLIIFQEKFPTKSQTNKKKGHAERSTATILDHKPAD